MNYNQNEKHKIIIIMAGGDGKRMKSSKPKVLHHVDGLPMIVKIIFETLLISPRKIFIVVGKHRYIIEKTISEHLNSSDINLIQFVDQMPALGTGHAIMSCRKHISRYNYANVLILSGDVPCITHNTMAKMFKNIDNCKVAIFEKENPFGYGRVIIDKDNEFVKIVEEKDANSSEKLIKTVNTGLYCINSVILCKYLPFLKNNNSQHEYYITDLIEIIKRFEKIKIQFLEIPITKHIEVTGINSMEQLNEVNQYLEALKLAY
tara:strand:+ start:41 stop:826 length:786 start_codon:yes stop_codon:yes gene_type:complete